MLTVSKETVDYVSSKVNTWNSILSSIKFYFKGPTPQTFEEMGVRNPIYLTGGYFFRELPDYIPNLKVIPGAWAEIVHKASGTLHRVYFETTLVKDLIKVNKHGVQPLIDLGYTQAVFKEKLVAAIKDGYILKDAWFNTDIKEEYYKKLWGKATVLNNGLTIYVTDDKGIGIKEKVILVGALRVSKINVFTGFYISNPFGLDYTPTHDDVQHILCLLRDLMRRHNEMCGAFSHFVLATKNKEYNNVLSIVEE